MAEKSKILVIGGTGYIGKFIVEGDIYDHNNLVKAIKKVDIVISAVGPVQISDQVKIIDAIKEAGNVKTFLPSEFGLDVDRSAVVEPAASSFKLKANIRRLIEAAGIPYTYVVSYGGLRYFLHNLGQLNAASPPRDKVTILGDGNPKAIFVDEEDTATYTIKAVEDPRTLNKNLYLRTPANTLSFNEIVSLWEKKIGNPLDKIYILEDQLLKQIQESSFPLNLLLSLCHSVFLKEDATSFEVQASFGVEASELYPEVKYTTIKEYLDSLV
nr:phenylcoumaran benzylic ether reductase Pyrc5-like isoform X2 [Ziziphus jujuba var. spinosa]